MEQRTYCAFISYRHYTPDKEIAGRLHRLIENYVIPSAMRPADGRKHPGRVFRDQEELPLSSDLGKDIENALDSSEWLICVCSPRYLESRWCMRELEYFIEHRGRDRVLAVLAEGEPEDAFPPLLCKAVDAEGNETDVEPLAADVRSGSLQGSLKKLRKEKLRILAPMLGTSFDGLYMRQKRRTRHRLALAACALAAAAGAFWGYHSYQQSALENQRIASAKNEYDLLLEQAAAAVNESQDYQARSLLLRAREISDSIGGYREEPLLQLLESACYASDMSKETKLDSAVDFLAVSAVRGTEYFSPDDTKVLIPSSGYTLDCCDAVTGQLLWRSSFNQLITSARWKEDSSRVVATSHMAHTLRVIDASSGETVSELTNVDWISAACYCGDKIFIAFEEGILIWDPEEDPEFQHVPWYMQDVLTGQGASGKVTPNDRIISKYTYGHFGMIDVTGPIFTYEPESLKVITGYAVSPDGGKMFVHQYDEVYVYDLYTDEKLWTVTREKPDRQVDDIPDSTGAPPVWAGEYIYDNERTTGDYLTYTGVVYNALTGEILYTLDDEICRGVTPDGKYFLCSGGAYEVETGVLAAKSVSYLYDTDSTGRRLLSAGYILTGMGAGTQYTVDEYSGRLYYDRNDMHRVLSPDDRFSVNWIPANGIGYSQQGFTVLWMDDSNRQYTIRDYTPSYFINFTPDSRLVALEVGNSVITVFELETGKIVYISKAWQMQHAMGGFTFSADGRYLMAATKEKDSFIVADMQTSTTLYQLYPTAKAADWGFDDKTGDAVVLYEDGSALCADIFTSADEILACARRLQAHPENE